MLSSNEATCSPHIRLVHVVAEKKWAFKDGGTIIRLGTIQTYFDTRAEAVQAAGRLGFLVDRYGCVKAVSKPAWIR